MSDFNFFLNRQGIQGRKGDKGDAGFTPTISVSEQTLNSYKLKITNEYNEFETPNLIGNLGVTDNGGTYLRYDPTSGTVSTGEIDGATTEVVGGIRKSTDADLTNLSADTAVTPANVADMLPLLLEAGTDNVTITQDEATSKTKISVAGGGGGTGDIPIATTTTAGKVKPDGTTITITDDGTISAVGGGGGGATIDDSTTATTSVWSSSKTNTEITTVDNKVVQVQGDVASLDSDVSTLKTDVSTLKTDVSGLKTNKQDKLVAGDNITIDPETNTISATGGGPAPTNMVTTDTDQTITGVKTFDQLQIKELNSIGHAEIYANNGLIVTNDAENVTTFRNTSYLETRHGTYASTATMRFGEYDIPSNAQKISSHTDGSGSYGDLILEANSNTDNKSSLKLTNNSLTFTASDGTVTNLLSGGGSTPANMVTTDTVQDITANKTFYGEIRVGADNNYATLAKFSKEAIQSGDSTLLEHIDLGEADFVVQGSLGKKVYETDKYVYKKYLTEVDVDNQTIQVVNGKLQANLDELNNPYSLFDSKYSDHELNNLSWLKSEGQWNSGTVYVDAYNELLAEYNNAESVEETEGTVTFKRTPKGYKIALSTQETAIDTKYSTDGIAWYYILDTTNTQFKLPRTKYGFEGLRTSVGDDIKAGLPNITGALDVNADRNVFNWGQQGAFYRDGSGGRAWAATESTTNSTGDIHFDASHSNPIYGKSNTVQPPATQMYLYFYVGETVQNANLIDAGRIGEQLASKLDLDAQNLSAEGKSLISGLAMPSNKYIDLTLGASGTKYTAPADGYIIFRNNVTAVGQQIQLQNATNGIQTWIHSGKKNGIIGCWIPVSKGDSATLVYDMPNNGVNRIFRFVYAVGSQPSS